jgi:hypothetical protein
MRTELGTKKRSRVQFFEEIQGCLNSEMKKIFLYLFVHLIRKEEIFRFRKIRNQCDDEFLDDLGISDIGGRYTSSC